MRRGLVIVVFAWGCVLHAEKIGDEACEEVVCSDNATCGGGECFCDQGFEGDPDATDGCQPIRPPAGGDCEEGCGLNAYCADGACYCEAGSVAVCGTADCTPESALCDGTNDCQNGADEDPAVCAPVVIQEWVLTDECDDALDIEWRLWAWDRDWVWPGPDEVFVTGGLYVDTYQSIECAEGELVCFGGQAGELVWGVGADGTEDCEDCCASCSTDLVDLGYLGC